MSAPVWQYIILLVLFLAGVILSTIGMLTTKGGVTIKEKIKKLTGGLFVIRSLAAMFGLYLSYSLLAFSGLATLPIVLISLHWFLVFNNFVKSTTFKDKETTFSYRDYKFSTIFSTCLLLLLICYGINYL